MGAAKAVLPRPHVTSTRPLGEHGREAGVRALAPARTLGCRRTDKTYARAPCRALLGQVYILGPTTGARRRARLCRRRSCRPVIYSPRDLRCVRPTASFLPGIPPICWTRSLRLTFFFIRLFYIGGAFISSIYFFFVCFSVPAGIWRRQGTEIVPPNELSPFSFYCRAFLCLFSLASVFSS